MTIEEIRELIKVATESGVAELEVQRGDNRVRIHLGSRVTHQDVYVTAPNSPPASASQVTPAHPVGPEVRELADIPIDELVNDPTLAPVKSPIVGTYYEAPSPGAEPFVKAGDTVHAGQVLCIIESMKLMNEIEAEVSGRIVRKLVENAQPVEYGEALFLIKPA
jgi:acetyl-CoA carboxylase biotin carboxyl carrier protein